MARLQPADYSGILYIVPNRSLEVLAFRGLISGNWKEVMNQSSLRAFEWVESSFEGALKEAKLFLTIDEKHKFWWFSNKNEKIQEHTIEVQRKTKNDENT